MTFEGVALRAAAAVAVGLAAFVGVMVVVPGSAEAAITLPDECELAGAIQEDDGDYGSDLDLDLILDGSGICGSNGATTTSFSVHLEGDYCSLTGTGVPNARLPSFDGTLTNNATGESLPIRVSLTETGSETEYDASVSASGRSAIGSLEVVDGFRTCWGEERFALGWHGATVAIPTVDEVEADHNPTEILESALDTTTAPAQVDTNCLPPAARSMFEFGQISVLAKDREEGLALSTDHVTLVMDPDNGDAVREDVDLGAIETAHGALVAARSVHPAHVEWDLDLGPQSTATEIPGGFLISNEMGPAAAAFPRTAGVDENGDGATDPPPRTGVNRSGSLFVDLPGEGMIAGLEIVPVGAPTPVACPMSEPTSGESISGEGNVGIQAASTCVANAIAPDIHKSGAGIRRARSRMTIGCPPGTGVFFKQATTRLYKVAQNGFQLRRYNVSNSLGSRPDEAAAHSACRGAHDRVWYNYANVLTFSTKRPYIISAHPPFPPRSLLNCE